MWHDVGVRRMHGNGAVALVASFAAVVVVAGVVPSGAATATRLQARSPSPVAAEAPAVRSFQAIVALGRPVLIFAFHPL